MQKSEYFEFAKAFFGQCIEIAEKKNADYTGKTPDPFANFSSVEVLGVSTEAGFLTRMMDKIKRVSSFVENGSLQVKDESVKDTLQDLANYCCLFAGYLESKKSGDKSEPHTSAARQGFALCIDQYDDHFKIGKEYPIVDRGDIYYILLDERGIESTIKNRMNCFIFNF